MPKIEGPHREEAARLYKLGQRWPVIANAIREKWPELLEGMDKETAKQTVRGWVRSDHPEYFTQEQPKAEPEKKTEPEKPYKEWHTYNGDGSQDDHRLLEKRKNQTFTPEQLLELHGFVPVDRWELIDAKCNVWNGTTGKQRNNELVELWQSTVRAKPKVQGPTLESINKHFESFKGMYGTEPVQFIQREGKMMAEVNIADLHFGKLCWHGDTGNDYDHKIAKRLFLGLVTSIAESLRGKPIEYITFVWTNDFFNSDTIPKTTTAGTPQDTDVRWQKMFNMGVEALVEGFEILSGIAPVKTFYSPSNHDEMVCYYAIKYLEAWFNGRSDIQVNIDAKARKYALYGKTLLCWSHGYEEHNSKKSLSIATLAALPPIEAREEWAQAKYCEVHVHHLHSEHAIEEQNGVIVRRISSPTATDTYHHRAAYVGQVRKAQTFLYDKEYGLLHTINTPVEAVI